MKIVRHTAPDMRQALRAIREQLGEDAVILSSRRVPQGVEITAAVDFDAAALETAAPAAVPSAGHVSHTRMREEADRTATRPALVSGRPPQQEPDPVHELGSTPAAAASAPLFPAQPEVPAEAMGKELQSLRRMLETQLAQLAWSDRARRAPVHAELLRELTEIGIAQDLADHIVGQLDERVDLTQGRRFAIAGLSQYLLVTGDRWLETGGRVAFIGATGVGKTTMLAKLAVRWILRHGPKDLALVASDTVRIGAQDQMQALGQLLGVPVHVPERFEALPELLSRLERHRMVLIDTPGSSLRDPQLGARLAVLAGCGSRLETALVLAAGTQAGALEEAV
ncbi:MAG TPA: flagellar biosynthesis protein FlhF, partial [Steroidobacteraceae bacterium]|nr:flagellar biosynthesis protein FlhF [Steroidobacteraceae bacterium]